MALTDKLSAIGEAIRAKTGKSDKLTLDQMPSEIAGITGGGSDVTLLEGLSFELDFSNGDMPFAAPSGYAVKSAIVKQPATLIPANIKSGVDVAGIVGTFEGGGGGSVDGCVTVTFKNGDTVLFSRPVYIGDDCPDPLEQGHIKNTPTKASTAQYYYTYLGWGNASGAFDANILKNIREDKTVYATFSATLQTYTIKFVDDDGSVLKSDTLTYGATPVAPTPTRDGFNLVGWSPAVSTVTGNVTYTAVWEAKVYYTITFLDDDGSVMETQTVEHGTIPEYQPIKNGYVLTGWVPEITVATADASYTAQWQLAGIPYSWAEISEMSTAGTAENYMSVGDIKPIRLLGTVGTLALDDVVCVYILGFNHNSEKEGSGVQFGCFKLADGSGKDFCLVDAAYSKRTDQSPYTGGKYFHMNRSNSSTKGWIGCDLRYDILGSTDVAPSTYGSNATTSTVGYDATATCATNPVENTLMSCLPADLRAVMKPITKWTNNVGAGSTGNTSASVTASVDYLPLLAEYEAVGNSTSANSYERNYQKRYAYFANGNSPLKYSYDGTSVSTSTGTYWSRSADRSSSGWFVKINNASSNYGTGASYSYGIAPVFMV